MTTGRYGEFLYGDGTTYGAAVATEGGISKWVLLFDWNNDGVLDSASEAGRLTNVSIEHGRQNYLAPQGGGFEHCRPATCTMLLDNYDRRYDPRYSSSALYPNVVPGRRMMLQVKDISTDSDYIVFTGKIDDIVPMVEKGGQGSVQIECVGYMAQLNDQILSFTAADQNITLTRAFEILLDDADFPGSRALDADTQPVIVYGVTDQNAGQVAHDLADAGMGTFFVDKSGRACFYGRNHSYPAATALDEAQCLSRPVISNPWAEVYNHVTAIANRPMRMQASVIYFLPGQVQLTAATPATIDVDYSSSFDVQVSAFEAWSNQNGTGTDLTASTTVSSSLGYNGGTVTVECSSNGWLTRLEIRGRQWGTVEEKKVAEDATSQTKYGLRRFLLDSPFLQDPNFAANHAGVIRTFAKDDRAGITVQIEGREDLQFSFDIMTPVALTMATLDIDDTYYVMGLEHQWTKDTGEGVVTTLYLSKIIADSTSVTPAPILNEPKEAPLGYENPAGDPETIDGISENPDIDLPIGGNSDLIYLGKSGPYNTVSTDGFINWSTSYIQQNSLMWSSVHPQWIRLQKGTYYFKALVSLTNSSTATNILVSVSITGYDLVDNFVTGANIWTGEFYNLAVISNGRLSAGCVAMVPSEIGGTTVHHIKVNYSVTAASGTPSVICRLIGWRLTSEIMDL